MRVDREGREAVAKMRRSCEPTISVHLDLQAARARVTARFGPELPGGAQEFVQLQELPAAMQKVGSTACS
jgi:hypothetical protein